VKKTATPKSTKAKVASAAKISSQEIRFYRASESPYGVFSNLSKHKVFFENQEFATAEHAYQAGKARKPEVRTWLLNAPSPALVAMAAHGLYTWDIVPDWAQTKFDRMRGVLRAKFSQHEELRKLLLSTGKKRLVESGTVDNAVNRLWGEVNGKGSNKLGVLLMELREELRGEFTRKSKRRTPKTESGRNTSAPMTA
jgi:ribA/ribD-fused uncharacterized protein